MVYVLIGYNLYIGKLYILYVYLFFFVCLFLKLVTLTHLSLLVKVFQVILGVFILFASK